MSQRSLFGWGGLRVVYGTADITFQYAIVKIEFQPEVIKHTLLDRSIRTKHKGFRPVITAKVTVYDSTEAATAASLIEMITASAIANATLTVYPRYTSTDAGSLNSYECYFDGSVSVSDLADNVSIGQEFDLTFIGKNLLQAVPVNVSIPNEIYLMWGAGADDYLVWNTGADDYLMAQLGV